MTLITFWASPCDAWRMWVSGTYFREWHRVPDLGAFAFIVLLAFALPAKVAMAQAGNCRATDDLTVFLDNLRAVATDGRSFNAVRANQLALSVESLRKRGFGVPVTTDSGSLGPVGVAMELVTESLSGGRVVEIGELRASLEAIERTIEYLCSLEETEVLSPANLDRPSMITRFGGMSDVAAAVSNVTPSLRVLGATLGVLISLVSLGYLTHRGYRRYFSWVNMRHSCKIYCGLEVGLDVVDGAVVILGRRGCRFLPVNEGAFHRIMAMEGLQESSIVIGGRRIACGGVGANRTAIVIYFEERLSREEVAELLTLSVEEPRFLLTKPPRLQLLS